MLIGGNYLLTLLLYFLPSQVHTIVLLDVVIMAAAGWWFVWHCRRDIESRFSTNTSMA
jgi:hypothetical protein